MSVPPLPPRHVLRQFVESVLPSDTEVTACCVDHFPQVAAQFSSGMSRTDKISRLLVAVGTRELLAALKAHAPARYAQTEALSMTHAVAAGNPYRGLSAFHENDAHLFFGRELLTEKLWRRFQALYENPQATRLLTILGPSGSGKSSVARAGLLAALQAVPVPGPQPLRLIVLRPGVHPLRALAIALNPLAGNAPTPEELSAQSKLAEVLREPNRHGEFDKLSFWAANRSGVDTAPFVVLVDQFEEVYTLCRDQVERDAFVRALLFAAADRARHLVVVLTLRSDFLYETQSHHADLNLLIAEHGVIVPALTPDELRQVIAKPAEQAGRPIDEATVALLLTEARNNESALPLLEFALTQIWEGMHADQPPGETLRAINGVGGALAGKARDIFRAFTVSEQATVKRALVRLVQLGEGTRDTRRRAPIRELYGSGETEADVLAVLRKLATDKARLVTLSGDGAAAVAEVTHEALFDHWQELREWLNESRADRRFHDRVVAAARLWDDDQRRPGRLWRRPDLDLLRDYHERKPEELSPLQSAFLRAATAQQQREKILSWGAVAAVCMALVGTVGVYLTEERQRAAEERQRTRDAAAASEQIRQQLLDSYVEQGRQLLLEKDNPSEAVLWLHRAQARRSTNSALPDLLRSARYKLEATHVVLVGHAGRVLSAMYSPDGKRIVTANADSTARIWDAETGRQLMQLTGTGYDLSAKYSPDGKHIVTTSLYDTVRVWNADTGRQVAVLRGDWHIVLSVVYSPDSKRIMTASEDMTARVWDAETGRQLAELKGHRDSVLSATYSPDGTRILTTSKDCTARVWDVTTGRPVAEFKGDWDGVASATYSPDGKRIVTASRDHTARIIDAETGHLLMVLKGHKDRVNSAMYSPDGKRIVTASTDNTVLVWDAESGRQLAQLKGHRASVWSAMYSPDGKRIVTASDDHTARVWNAKTGPQIAEMKGNWYSVLSATYSPDGKRILTTNWDHSAHLMDAETGYQSIELKGHGDRVNSAAHSPRGNRIVTVGDGLVARVWDAETGYQVAELRGHQDVIRSAAYSPDGKRIVTASDDHTACVWDAETGHQLVVLNGHGARVNSAAYSSDGRRIVTASDGLTAGVWDADTGQLLAELRGHKDAVLSAAYSPNGHYIVTASDDQTARLWDAQTGRPLAELKGHGSSVNSALFSPDGRSIVTTSYDQTARLWDAHTGHQVAELKGHAQSIRSAAFSPDGKRIVTASADHTARVWDAETGGQIAELKGHGDNVYNATYSPDGKRIVTASADRTARIWDVSPETQTADQIAKLIRCKVGVRFDREDSNVMMPTLPNPAECLPGLPLQP